MQAAASTAGRGNLTNGVRAGESDPSDETRVEEGIRFPLRTVARLMRGRQLRVRGRAVSLPVISAITSLKDVSTSSTLQWRWRLRALINARDV